MKTIYLSACAILTLFEALLGFYIVNSEGKVENKEIVAVVVIGFIAVILAILSKKD